jgi:hypothetical protein
LFTICCWTYLAFNFISLHLPQLVELSKERDKGYMSSACAIEPYHKKGLHKAPMFLGSRTLYRAQLLTVYYTSTFLRTRRPITNGAWLTLAVPSSRVTTRNSANAIMSLRVRDLRSFTASPGFKNTKELGHRLMSQICWCGSRYLKPVSEDYMSLGFWARWLLSFYILLAFANYRKP